MPPTGPPFVGTVLPTPGAAPSLVLLSLDHVLYDP